MPLTHRSDENRVRVAGIARPWFVQNVDFQDFVQCRTLMARQLSHHSSLSVSSFFYVVFNHGVPGDPFFMSLSAGRRVSSLGRRSKSCRRHKAQLHHQGRRVRGQPRAFERSPLVKCVRSVAYISGRHDRDAGKNDTAFGSARLPGLVASIFYGSPWALQQSMSFSNFEHRVRSGIGNGQNVRWQIDGNRGTSLIAAAQRSTEPAVLD